jgi:hypothetical protein
MKAFEKLIQDCEQQDVAAAQKERDIVTITDKVTRYKTEIHNCSAERERLLKQAEQIIVDAKQEAQKKIDLAETIRQNIAKFRTRLESAEAELRKAQGKPALNPVLLPSTLGLGR